MFSDIDPKHIIKMINIESDFNTNTITYMILICCIRNDHCTVKIEQRQIKLAAAVDSVQLQPVFNTLNDSSCSLNKLK